MHCWTDDRMKHDAFSSFYVCAFIMKEKCDNKKSRGFHFEWARFKISSLVFRLRD